MNLAASFALRGYRVILLDADMQETAAGIAGDDFPARVVFIGGTGTGLIERVEELSADMDIVVIDCPPAADRPETWSAALVSDLVLVPVVPNPYDLLSAPTSLELVRMAMAKASALKGALVVPNRFENTKVSQAFLARLQDLSFPVAETVWKSRTAFVRAAAFGLSVHTQRDKKAIHEVESLADEVLTIVDLPPNAPKEEDDAR